MFCLRFTGLLALTYGVRYLYARQCVFIGAILAVLSFIFTSLAKNGNILFVSYGLLLGKPIGQKNKLLFVLRLGQSLVITQHLVIHLQALLVRFLSDPLQCWCRYTSRKRETWPPGVFRSRPALGPCCLLRWSRDSWTNIS